MSKKGNWMVLEENGWKIVIPRSDIKAHGKLPEGEKIRNGIKVEIAWSDCPCKPEVSWENQIIIHNSFEDVEKIEESMKKVFPTS